MLLKCCRIEEINMAADRFCQIVLFVCYFLDRWQC